MSLIKMTVVVIAVGVVVVVALNGFWDLHFAFCICRQTTK